MDPTETLRIILAELNAGNTGEYTTDALRFLADWLDGGGFAPNVAKAIEGANLNTENS
jgi:hypothetical protein